MRITERGCKLKTWNRYAYVGNNPLSNVDPLGLDDSTTTCVNGTCTNVTNVDVNRRRRRRLGALSRMVRV